jgi:hypothetical protein
MSRQLFLFLYTAISHGRASHWCAATFSPLIFLYFLIPTGGQDRAPYHSSSIFRA